MRIKITLTPIKIKINVKSKNLKNSKTNELIKAPPLVTKVNGLQVEMTSIQKEAINVGLVAAAHYNRVEILKYLLSLGTHVDFVAEMEITQLYDEPEADNVFYDMTGNDLLFTVKTFCEATNWGKLRVHLICEMKSVLNHLCRHGFRLGYLPEAFFPSTSKKSLSLSSF